MNYWLKKTEEDKLEAFLELEEIESVEWWRRMQVEEYSNTREAITAIFEARQFMDRLK